MAKSIFISYRRGDAAGVAGRVHDRLLQGLKPEQVFLDVDAIEGGADFESRILTSIAHADVMLVLIGRNWAGPSQSDGHARIWQSDDYVRKELRAALDRSGAMKIIPVLLDGAPMPKSDELPQDIVELCRLNGLPLRHERFDDDVEFIFKAAQGEPKAPRGASFARVTWLLMGVAAGLLFALMIAVAHYKVFEQSLSETLGVYGAMLFLAVCPAVGALTALRMSQKRLAKWR